MVVLFLSRPRSRVLSRPFFLPPPLLCYRVFLGRINGFSKFSFRWIVSVRSPCKTYNSLKYGIFLMTFSRKFCYEFRLFLSVFYGFCDIFVLRPRYNVYFFAKKKFGTSLFFGFKQTHPEALKRMINNIYA